MHRTDADGHVANAFSDGDPGIPTQGTLVEEDWLNAVQGELVNTIEDAGTTLVKGTNTQLRDVVRSVIGSFFGDGSDGDVTVTTTVTLARDMFYENLTVGAGGTLVTAGFRVYVRGTLTTSGGGKITANGSQASAATGGAGAPEGTVKGGSTGGNGGGIGAANATTGTNLNPASGGAGGTGGTGQFAAAVGGTVTAPAATRGSPRAYSPDTFGGTFGVVAASFALSPVVGGAGGGGSGSDAANAGRGGGGGGGVLCVGARKLQLAAAADLIAAGAAGIAAVPSTQTGGGSGGGGGVLLVVYQIKNVVTFAAATNTPGGAGSAAGGLGVSTAGAAGSNGSVVEIALGP